MTDASARHAVRPRTALFAADSQTLAAFRAAALENEPAVFRGHANEKAVRLTATTSIWLERALTLHGPLRSTRTLSARPASGARQPPLQPPLSRTNRQC